MSFYWKNICKQKTAPESEKVGPALKFMLNIPRARESVRQAHTFIFCDMWINTFFQERA